MTKGRNTSVVSVRLPDEIVTRLKKIAKNRRQSMTELLKPVIGNFAVRDHIKDVIHTPEPAQNVIEEPPDLDIETGYWKEPKPKFEASPKPESRNKARVKRKTKKKRH